MRFYLNKIGGHLQELAILAMVFVPLDRHLNLKDSLLLYVPLAIILLAGIETERRTR